MIPIHHRRYPHGTESAGFRWGLCVALLVLNPLVATPTVAQDSPPESASPPAASVSSAAAAASAAGSPPDAPSPEASEPGEKDLQTLLQELHVVESGVADATVLEQYEAYRAFDDRYGETPGLGGILASRLAWKLSALGDYGGAHRAFDQGPFRLSPSDETLEAQRKSLGGLEVEDAVGAIVDASRGRRAVMINEAHHVPQHRALTRRLLPALREAGFTHFAAETLSPFQDGLAEKGYPTAATGLYTDEPLYADLVRGAVALGYEVVPYEAVGAEEYEDRELSQAKKLKERVIDVSPEARVLVHLGYGHNQESAVAFRGKPAMAFYFQKITGFDPLTVDQALLTERSSPDLEYPLYDEVCGTLEEPGALAFRNADGELWSLPRTERDITVCSPRSARVEGRPTWLLLGGLRRFVPLDVSLCDGLEVCVVEARRDGEGPDAIPVDRVRIRAGEAAKALALPAGSFTILVHGADGRPVRSAKLVVRP
ncbi:MAG: hypothetical protein AAGF23_15315 [Acidobacteriota bacterium]